MLSSQFSNIRRTRFHQSSPVQPVSDFRGGSTNLTHKRTNERKSLCLILDLSSLHQKVDFPSMMVVFLSLKGCIHISKWLSFFQQMFVVLPSVEGCVPSTRWFIPLSIRLNSFHYNVVFLPVKGCLPSRRRLFAFQYKVLFFLAEGCPYSSRILYSFELKVVFFQKKVIFFPVEFCLSSSRSLFSFHQKVIFLLV